MAQTDSRPKRVGTTLLIEPLGKGGMAEVWRAVQEPLQREVAVKVISGKLAKDPESVTRFRREAMALAGMQHENVVGIHDLIEKTSKLYMVLEYVEGVDLSVVLKEGPLPVEVALLVASQVAAALEHAHFRKVVHRDVKPGNVLLSRFGEVKLTDFGIAKDQTIDDLTRTGLLVGTPSYLSPEQVGGKKADGRSDVWALGVMLFESLTGKKPFTGSNAGELFLAIHEGKRPPLRQLAPELPEAVVRIVEKCLVVDRTKRWQRAADLRRALEGALEGRLKGTPAAHLVAFLKDRGHVREDDLSCIDMEELWFVAAGSTPTEQGLPPPAVAGKKPGLLRRLVLAVLLILALAGLGSAAAYQVAPEETLAAFEALRASLLSR